jgi:hypothetical protein
LHGLHPEEVCAQLLLVIDHGLTRCTGYRILGKCSCFSFQKGLAYHLRDHWDRTPLQKWKRPCRQGS